MDQVTDPIVATKFDVVQKDNDGPAGILLGDADTEYVYELTDEQLHETIKALQRIHSRRQTTKTSTPNNPRPLLGASATDWLNWVTHIPPKKYVKIVNSGQVVLDDVNVSGRTMGFISGYVFLQGTADGTRLCETARSPLSGFPYIAVTDPGTQDSYWIPADYIDVV